MRPEAWNCAWQVAGVYSVGVAVLGVVISVDVVVVVGSVVVVVGGSVVVVVTGVVVVIGVGDAVAAGVLGVFRSVVAAVVAV